MTESAANFTSQTHNRLADQRFDSDFASVQTQKNRRLFDVFRALRIIH
jgi:hypothetical protein